MPTINTKKVGNTYEPTSIEYDPYSEYEHVEEPVSQLNTVEVHKPTQQELRPKEELFKNVDKLFEGANLVFDLADHVIKHLRGRR